MKTAMMELIEFTVGNDRYQWQVIDKMRELLEMEKQQIIDAHNIGWQEGVNTTPVPESNGTGYESETYYSQTYTQTT